MDNIFEVEKLNSIRNEMTHLWGAIFFVGGGSIALLLNSSSVLGYILAIVGALLSIILAQAYFVRRNEVVKIVKNLEDK